MTVSFDPVLALYMVAIVLLLPILANRLVSFTTTAYLNLREWVILSTIFGLVTLVLATLAAAASYSDAVYHNPNVTIIFTQGVK